MENISTSPATNVDLSSSFKAYDVRGIVGETITAASVKAVVTTFVEVLGLAYTRKDVTVDELDGITFTAKDGSWWFNLRASNTEPFLRLNAEAVDAVTMADIRDAVLELVRQ